MRNITVNNAQIGGLYTIEDEIPGIEDFTGIYNLWNWGWTFQGVTINNCQVGSSLYDLNLYMY